MDYNTEFSVANWKQRGRKWLVVFCKMQFMTMDQFMKKAETDYHAAQRNGFYSWSNSPFFEYYWTEGSRNSLSGSNMQNVGREFGFSK